MNEQDGVFGAVVIDFHAHTVTWEGMTGNSYDMSRQEVIDIVRANTPQEPPPPSPPPAAASQP